MEAELDVVFSATPIMPLDADIKRADYRQGVMVNTGGYLSGDFPDGITHVEGVPGPAIIRVLVRSKDPLIDGVMVAQVESGVDGTWRVGGLDTSLRYDVICRHDGYNDMILSNVTPVVS